MANQQTLFPGVNYRLGPTRQLPLSGDYITQLMDAVKRTDPGLTIDITSAGQVAAGTPGPRTGSDRHDIDHTGHGHTSDLVLVRDGQDSLAEVVLPAHLLDEPYSASSCADRHSLAFASLAAPR